MAAGSCLLLILLLFVTIAIAINDSAKDEAETKCNKGFYLGEDGLCEPCDKSCLTFCRAKGPKGCEVCRDGYTWEPDYGCLDIDECHERPGFTPCQKNSFCINTEGHYDCFVCDKACDGCDGDGPDFCKRCATGYTMVDGICRDKSIQELEAKFEMGRYMTYIGLCVATCIIFQKNIWIASTIGCLVAFYIALAEYTIRTKTPADAPNPIEEAIMKAQSGIRDL